MLEFNLEFKDFEKLEKRFEEIDQRLSNLDEGIEEGLANIIREDVMLRFQSAPPVESGGVVWGDVEWTRLSEGYLNSKPERRGGNIYIDTGAFRDSLTIQGHPDQLSEVEGEKFTFGTRLEYSGKLQEKRPVIFIHPILLEKLTEFFAKYIAGEINKDGTRLPERNK